MNINKVILVGRLTRDPEVRTLPSGKTVTRISLATSSTWKDAAGQKQEKTEFHNIVAFGKLGEIAGQYLVKGQETYFEGRIQTNKYTGKDGVEKRATDIIVENMQMGSKPQGAARQGGSYQPQAQSAAPSQAKEAAMEEIPTINLDDEEEVRIEDVPF